MCHKTIHQQQVLLQTKNPKSSSTDKHGGGPTASWSQLFSEIQKLAGWRKELEGCKDSVVEAVIWRLAHTAET